MPIQRLIIVQPCYSLEDLPRNLDAESATDYHACWTALWHPKFLQKVPSLPEWKRSDTSSLDVQQSLVFIPEAAKSQVDTTLRERLDLNENSILGSAGSRSENIAQIARLLEIELVPQDTASFAIEANPNCTPEQSSSSSRTPVCVHSFYALGFAYQQLNILTRKVHYSNNLDLMLFQEQVNKAASAFCNADMAEAEKWLQSSFDMLSQERDRYFSQQANLIDLTLLATSTLGDAFTKQLQRPHPQNVLASASMLKQLKERNATAFELLKQRCGAGELDIVGGMARETASPWLGSDAFLRNIANGRSDYEQLELPAPKVFSRLTGGTQAHDSQLLRISGMSYAMLSAWLDGELPRSDQAKIRWQSADSTTIDALSSFVLDAESSLSILSIAVELAKQFDYHQIPTLVLAHWPNRYCEAFIELMLTAERSSALGCWKQCEDYFETTGQAYSNTSLTSSQFKFPLPQDQEGMREFCKAWSLCANLQTSAQFLNSAALMIQQLGQWMSRKSMADKIQQDLLACKEIEQQVDVFAAGVVDLFRDETAVRALGESPVQYDAPQLSKQVGEMSLKVAGDLVALVSGKNPTNVAQCIGEQANDRTSHIAAMVMPKNKSVYLINPQSAPMRFFLRSGSAALSCADGSRVYAQEQSSSARKLMDSGAIGNFPSAGVGGHEVIVDVSAYGIVQLNSGAGATASATKAGLAQSNLNMNNEYIDVQIDANTGYLRSLLVNRKRGSRMSGQLSICAPEKLIGTSGNADQQYAVPKNVKITLEHNSTLSAIIVSRGALVHQGQELAEFEIWYELWRGSRMLQITPKVKWKVSQPGGLGVWEGAPVWRSAWPSEAASLRTWQQDMSTRVNTATIFSPQILEIDDAEHRLFLMTSGACLHRRRQSAYLDTHLGGGNQASLLVGLDVPNPLQQWQHWTQPNWIIDSEATMANDQAAASFLSTSLKGVTLRWIDPQTYFAKVDADVGENDIFRRFDAYLFVQETMGKAGNARLQFFRDVKKAAKVNSSGVTDELLTVEQGDVLLPLRTCESVWLGVDWLQ